MNGTLNNNFRYCHQGFGRGSLREGVYTVAVFFTLWFHCTLYVHAQNNVGIGTNTPAPSALLDLTSTDKGILIPRIADTTLVAAPATGLLIFQSTDTQFYYFDGNWWRQALGPEGPQGPVGPTGADGAANAWSLTGNAGTTAGPNFLGTTDMADLAVYTNNLERMRIESGGNLGVGTSAPEVRADIAGGDVLIDNNQYYMGELTTGVNISMLGVTSQDNIAVGSISGAGGGDLVFELQGAEKARLKSSGNLGVGTTTPQNTLDVEGGMAIGSSYSGTAAAPANGMIVEGNVGIGTSNPVSSAILDLTAANQGLLPPRTDTATVNSFAAPTAGLLIYQITDNYYYYHDGSKWVRLVSSGGSGNMQMVVKSADQGVSNDAVLDAGNEDTELKFPVVANGVYGFELAFYTGDPSADMQFDFSVPPGTTINYESRGHIPFGGLKSQCSNGAPLSVEAFGTTGSLIKGVRITGNIAGAPSAGIVEFRFCQNSSSATNTTVKQGSHIKYFKQ